MKNTIYELFARSPSGLVDYLGSFGSELKLNEAIEEYLAMGYTEIKYTTRF